MRAALTAESKPERKSHMSKIREDLEGVVVIGTGGDPIILHPGDDVPEGVELGDHVLAGDDVPEGKSAKTNK